MFHLYHPLYWTSHSGTCSSRISEQLARLATAATILISVECFAPIDAQHLGLGIRIFSFQECFHHSGMMLSWPLCRLARLALSQRGFLHICHRTARLFQYKYLLFRNNYTTTDDMYFSVLLMARSLGYCCKLEALLSRYKYLLFRIAYTTAE